MLTNLNRRIRKHPMVACEKRNVITKWVKPSPHAAPLLGGGGGGGFGVNGGRLIFTLKQRSTKSTSREERTWSKEEDRIKNEASNFALILVFFPSGSPISHARTHAIMGRDESCFLSRPPQKKGMEKGQNSRCSPRFLCLFFERVTQRACSSHSAGEFDFMPGRSRGSNS